MRPTRTFTVTLLATLLIAVLGVASLSGVGRLVSDEPVGNPWGPVSFGTYSPRPTFASSGQFGEIQDGQIFHLPGWVAQLLIAVIVGALALVVIRFLFLIAANVEKRRNAVAVDAEQASAAEPDLELDEVQESLDQTLEDLRAGLDVHGSIIECWRRLADLAAASGVPRRASQTAEEYTLAILGSLPVDRDDLGTLADLYQAAMFSNAESAPADRDLATSCLSRLSAAMGTLR